MQCDQIFEKLLDLGWDGKTRQRAAEVLAHLQTCDACRAAAEDFDELRDILSPKDDQEDVSPPGGWDAFQQRIENSVQLPNYRLTRPVIGWISGIAAALVMGVVGLVVGRHQVSQDPQLSVALPTANGLTGTDISTDLHAFREVTAAYGNKASWVMLSDKIQDFKADAPPAEANQPILLLRITLLHEDASSHGASSIVSKSDLIIIPGQPADLTIPLHDGQQFHYHVITSAQTPTRLTLSAELHGPGQELLAALATRLTLTDDTNLTAGKIASNAGDYRLEIAFARSMLSQGGK